MKTRCAILGTFALLITSTAWVSGMEAQAPAPQPAKSSRPDLVTVQKPAQGVPNLHAGAGLLADVQKLIEAGTDESVTKAYIENWTGRFYITADDILRLHDLGASSDLLTVLIRRGGELRNQNPTPGLVTTNAPAMGPADTDQPPPMVVYPYPSASSYPANVYSYLYPTPVVPDYSYRYWSVPYSYYWYNWSSWPWYYPSYSYAWWYYPYYRHGYRGYHHGWGKPGYAHWRSPGNNHWRGSGIQPWRPATSSFGWRGTGNYRYEPRPGRFAGRTPGFSARPSMGYSGRPSFSPGFSGRPSPGASFSGRPAARPGFSGRGAVYHGGGFSGGGRGGGRR